MSETEKTPTTAADTPVPTPPEAQGEALDRVHAQADADAAKAEANVAKGRAKAAELGEALDKLEEEAFPERPEPVHVHQAIGT